MGSFLPASALDTFFIFLQPFFSLPLSPFIVIFSASVFHLPTFSIRVWNCVLPSTGQDKIKMNGKWRKWQFPLFATTWTSYIPSPPMLCFVLCVYERFIFACCLGEDKLMRLYSEEKKRVLERGGEEIGRPLREVQPVENLQACQFQLVHSELWTQHFISLVL